MLHFSKTVLFKYDRNESYLSLKSDIFKELLMFFFNSQLLTNQHKQSFIVFISQKYSVSYLDITCHRLHHPFLDYQPYHRFHQELDLQRPLDCPLSSLPPPHLPHSLPPHPPRPPPALVSLYLRRPRSWQWTLQRQVWPHPPPVHERSQCSISNQLWKVL